MKNILRGSLLGAVVATAISLFAQVSQPTLPTQSQCDVRLSAQTGVAVPASDIVTSSNVFVVPFRGNICWTYNGTSWERVTVTQQTVPVPANADANYDVFCFGSSGALSCDTAVQWTNDTTRATDLTTQDGVYAKTGLTTRRYIGSFRSTSAGSLTTDTTTKRHVYSYYNRVRRDLKRYETATTWTYTTATVRQANNNAANQVDVLVGVAESTLDLTLNTSVSGATNVSAGIGSNSTTTYTSGQMVLTNSSGSVISTRMTLAAFGPGRFFYSWNEWSTASGTTTWSGAVAAMGSTITSGLIGSIDN